MAVDCLLQVREFLNFLHHPGNEKCILDEVLISKYGGMEVKF